MAAGPCQDWVKSNRAQALPDHYEFRTKPRVLGLGFRVAYRGEVMEPRRESHNFRVCTKAFG